MQPELIRAIARAQYIRRHFTNMSLSALVWTDIQHNIVVEQMKAWKNLSENERQVWLDAAQEWLEQVENERPNIYNLLVEGVVNVELEGDYDER